VVSESLAGTARPSAGGRAFWWRLVDNLFRRLVLYALPVLVFGTIGVMQARSTLELYRSSATLSASTNPLLPETPVSGVDVQLWETPAAATSRIISERLGTNAFLEAVATDAGLGAALRNGSLTVDVIRASVWTSASGESILSVNATWADPQTAFQLVSATLDQYQAFLNETVASDTATAEAFWTDRLETLEPERDKAEDALTDYVAGLPELDDGEEYPATIQVQVNRLSGRLESVEAEIRTVEENIDFAKLTQNQQMSAAGKSFSLVDPPEVPGSPESTLVKKAMLVVAFAMMGAVVSIAALLITTVLDRGVSSAAELRAIPGVTQVATVPPVLISTTTRPRRVRRVRRAQAW